MAVMADTAGPVARSNWLLWPTPQAKVLAVLPSRLAQLPPELQLQMVLPKLLQLTASVKVAPLVLPSLLAMGQQLEAEDFMRHIAPAIAPLMAIERPVARSNRLLWPTPQAIATL